MATRSRGRSQRRSQRRSKSQRGGGMEGIRSNGAPTGGMDISNVIKNIVENKPPESPTMPQTGGALDQLSPAPYGAGPGGFAKSQYYTISGGSRRRSRRKHRKHKGGNTVLATAAVPFGLLALQRYFKGSKTSKKGVAKMGRSFKRTFRRRY